MPKVPSRRVAADKRARARRALEAHKRESARENETMRGLSADLAEKLTVPTVRLPLLDDHTRVPAVMALLDNGITELQRKNALLLPRFAPTGVLSVFSDYGGSHSRSKFETYSFLIADSGFFIKKFLESVKKIRKKYRIPEDVEISYKNLTKGSLVYDCIDEFTQAARKIFGLVLTLIVDKSAGSIFVPGSEGGLARLHSELAERGIRAYKPAILERAMRISYTFAYLLKLAANRDRKVLWLPDRDPIMVNERTMDESIRLLNLCSETLGDHKERRVEVVPERQIDHFSDFLAIPDLIAGAAALLMTQREEGPAATVEKPGFESAMSLVDNQGLFLRNLFFRVRRIENEQLHGEMISFSLKRKSRKTMRVLI